MVDVEMGKVCVKPAESEDVIVNTSSVVVKVAGMC